MSKKFFTVAVIACLAGLGMLAMQLRPTTDPTAAVTAPAGPTIETTVIQRTQYVRKHVRRKTHKARSSAGSASSASSGTTYSAPQIPAANVNTAPAPAPHPTTSPSSTGGGGEGENEHEGSEHGDSGESEGQDD